MAIREVLQTATETLAAVEGLVQVLRRGDVPEMRAVVQAGRNPVLWQRRIL